MEGYITSLVIFAAIFSLFGLGLNLQWGFTGLTNFGHVAFLMVGAYTTVLLSLKGVPVIVAVGVGAFLAAGLGLLIGFSTLRLREDYLAIVTIGVSEILRLVALNEENLTQGARGVYGYPLPMEKFAPTLFSKGVMISLLTVVVGLAYWRLWHWLKPVLKGANLGLTLKNAAILGAYLGSLGGLLVGTVVLAQQLKASPLPPGLQEVLLLGILGTIAAGYGWLGQRVIGKIPHWQQGGMVVTGLLCLGLGGWFYVIGAKGLYDYNFRSGLMLLVVMAVALTFAALEWLVHSPWGRVLKAIREDEEVAKALGKNVFWYKLQSLMLGGAIAGIAGAFYTWQLTFINPDNFSTLMTFQAWTIVVVGGSGSNVGTLLGAIIFWAYTTLTRFVLEDIIPLDAARLGALRVMIIGLILMLLMVWRPQGILGNKAELTLGR